MVCKKQSLMLYRSMSDTNKPFVSVCRKRRNELCYLTRSSSSSSSVNPVLATSTFFFVQDFSLSSPVLSRGRTRLVSGKHCLGTCFDSNVKLPWLAPQRRSFSFSSHSHAYLSSLPSQVCIFMIFHVPATCRHCLPRTCCMSSRSRRSKVS